MISIITSLIVATSVVAAQPTQATPNFRDVAPYCASLNETEMCLAEFACHYDVKQSACVADSVATERLNEAACYPKNKPMCEEDPRCYYEDNKCKGADDMISLYIDFYTAIDLEGVQMIADGTFMNVSNACELFNTSTTCLKTYGDLCAWENNLCSSVPAAIASMNQFECESMYEAGCQSALHCDIAANNTCTPSETVAVIGDGSEGEEGDFYGEEGVIDSVEILMDGEYGEM